MRAAVLLAALWLTGCQCLIDRDARMERRCPPSKCESSCRCQPGDVCPATDVPQAAA